jgi:hypothetical protein
MKTFNRLLLVLAIAVLPGLAVARAETCTDPSITPSNPDSIYSVNSDGTATDTRSGLMWKRCSEGQTWIASLCNGSATGYSWKLALTQAAGSGFAGHSDWRLPSVKELSTLIEPCRENPAINDSVFPETPSSDFWSGSPYAYTSGYAWRVSFGYDYGYDYGRGLYHRNGGLKVRLVRGGQSFASFDLAAIQTITFDAAPSVQVGKTGSVSATGGASGQPVIFTSNTPTICTISGSLVSGVAVGTCTIAANQAASGNYNAAPQVTQSFPVTAVPTYTLTVNSTGASNVAISAAPTSYGGTTPYSKTGIAAGSNLTLTAPATASGTLFLGWLGCSGAAGAFCPLTLNATTTVTASYKTLLSQAIAFGVAPTGLKVGGTGFLNATASSGLTVAFTSSSTGICTVTGSTVSALAVGTCTVAANQPGDSTYSAAPPMTQSFSIAPPAGASAPKAPTISSITPGRASATLQLVAPTANGGSAIIAYRASCTASNQPAQGVSGAGLTLTVRSLKGRTPYACTATASNAYYSSVASAASTVTPQAGGASLTPILLLLLD